MVETLKRCKAWHKGLGFLSGPSSLLKAVSSLLISSHPFINPLIFKRLSKGKYTWCEAGLEQLPACCLPRHWDGDGQGNYLISAGETRIFSSPFPLLIERQLFSSAMMGPPVFQHRSITNQSSAGTSPSGAALQTLSPVDITHALQQIPGSALG